MVMPAFFHPSGSQGTIFRIGVLWTNRLQSKGPKMVPSPESLLPLKPEFFHILLALNDKDLHGYAIIKEIEAATQGRMSLDPSPLYRRLKKLTDDGVIRETDIPPTTESGDERRRYYGLTQFGRKVMAAEAARVVELATNIDVRNLAAGI